MQLFEDMIRTYGEVRDGDVLKVGSFFNQQVDIGLAVKIGEEFYRLFKDCGVTKVVTIEASGIVMACTTAQFFNVPMVFAKKSSALNSSGDVYAAPVRSYTRGNTYNVTLPREYLQAGERVLLVDDFLATGSALFGLLDICRQAGAEVVGIGVGVEKAFQEGGGLLRDKGYRVEALARVGTMDPKTGYIEFVK